MRPRPGGKFNKTTYTFFRIDFIQFGIYSVYDLKIFLAARRARELPFNIFLFDYRIVKLNNSFFVCLEVLFRIAYSRFEKVPKIINIVLDVIFVLRKALKDISEPLTAKKITLSAEDLKDAPVKQEGAAAYSAAAPSGAALPAAVKGSAPDIAENNETAKSGKPDASDKAPVRATAERAKPSKNSKLTAEICSAAALVIVAVICVVVGISKHKAPDITSNPSDAVSDGSVPDSSVSVDSSSESDSLSGTSEDIYNQSYPEMKDGKLLFENNNRISKENLMRFDGDVKVTLELEDLLIPNYNKEVRINDYNGDGVDVIAFNIGIYIIAGSC